MGAIMLKIKELLCDIVKYTYGQDCNEKYLKFYVEISDKNSLSYHGKYNERNHKITICNTYRDDESILCTTVHELAHHIDCCNRGTSNHQKPFYAEYEKLLFTAMNMGIIHKKKFLDTTKDASDSNKIRKMMDNYIPHPIPYKQNQSTVSVYNSFAIKNELSSRGYHFNGNTKAWEKETDTPEQEKEWLEQFKDIQIEISDATDLHFEGEIKLIAMGDTYSIKDELNAAGFHYQNKKWIYKAKNENEVTEIKKKFPSITFSKK